jgi:hypothetical protein
MGMDMTYEELVQLPLVDRCRHVILKHFPRDFSAGEVAAKLNSLHPTSPNEPHYSPMEVHDALTQFYGRPNA